MIYCRTLLNKIQYQFPYNIFSHSAEVVSDLKVICPSVLEYSIIDYFMLYNSDDDDLIIREINKG